jgi:hypothetical protein
MKKFKAIKKFLSVERKQTAIARYLQLFAKRLSSEQVANFCHNMSSQFFPQSEWRIFATT